MVKHIKDMTKWVTGNLKATHGLENSILGGGSARRACPKCGSGFAGIDALNCSKCGWTKA